jgi:HEAT repeat protein
MQLSVRVFAFCLMLGLLGLTGSTLAENLASAPIVRLTYTDPPVHLLDPVKTLHASFLPLWHSALKHAEADLRRQIANAVAVAHLQGYRDLREFAVPLKQALANPNLLPVIRTDFAKALIAIDARQSEQELLKWLGTSQSYDSAVNVALANWQSKKLLKNWLSNVTDQSVRLEKRLLAAKCLGLLKQIDDSQPLRQVVQSDAEHPQLRIAVARALSRLDDKNAITVANSLIEKQDVVSQLLAADLLNADASKAAGQLNEQLSGSNSPLVVAAVWPRVLKSNPAALAELAEQQITNSDARVRELSVQALNKSPTSTRIELLANRLGDRHEAVRAAARDALLDLADNKQFDNQIRQLATGLLDKDDWRAQEQAIIVLSKLDHEAAATTFIKLLDHKEEEVATAAAWGLQVVANADTFPVLLQRAHKIERAVKASKVTDLAGIQLAYFFEMFGKEDYRPAETLMRLYIPKTQDHFVVLEARAAAVYAIGLFYEDSKDKALTAQLIERLNDVESFTPEVTEVRYASAVAVGRIKHAGFLADLQIHADSGGAIAFVSQWAIHKITGKPFVQPPASRIGREWILTPLKPNSTPPAKQTEPEKSGTKS